jgi:hypothetical protein
MEEECECEESRERIAKRREERKMEGKKRNEAMRVSLAAVFGEDRDG